MAEERKKTEQEGVNMEISISMQRNIYSTYLAGESVADIASRLGVTKGLVRDAIKKVKEETLKAGREGLEEVNLEILTSRQRSIYSAYLTGESVADIASRLGITVGAVYATIREAERKLMENKKDAIGGLEEVNLEFSNGRQHNIYSAYLAGESVADIVHRFDITENEVFKIIKKAKKNFRKGWWTEASQDETAPSEPAPSSHAPETQIQLHQDDKKLHGGYGNLEKYKDMDINILTELEQRVLKYRLAGKSNAEIAKLEFTSPNAIAGIMNRIKKKADGTYIPVNSHDPKYFSYQSAERNIRKDRNIYTVFICVGGKDKYIGCSKKLENAIKLRDAAEYARDNNFFDEWMEKFLVAGRNPDTFNFKPLDDKNKKIKIEEQKESIYSAYLAGESMIDIARHLGITKGVVRDAIKKVKEETLKAGIEGLEEVNLEILTSRQRSIYSAYLTGESAADIASRLGITVGGVYNTIKAAERKLQKKNKKDAIEEAEEANLEILTPWQHSIYSAYLAGESAADIASRLGITVGGVYNTIKVVESKFLEILTPKQYSIYSAYLVGVSVADIAGRLGITSNAVYDSIKRARKRLKESIGGKRVTPRKNLFNLSKDKKLLSILTESEQSILQYLIAGKSNEEIARLKLTNLNVEEGKKTQEQKEFNLKNLTPKQYNIYSAYLAGESAADIARRRGITRQAVYNIIKTAEKKLKEGTGGKRVTPRKNLFNLPKDKKLHGNYENLEKYKDMDINILTELEQRVLKYRLAGKSNAEIAKLEFTSPCSVSVIVNRIKHKADSTYIQGVERNIKKNRNLYTVFIFVEGKYKYIGCSKNLENAIKLRDAAEYARDNNFFDEWMERFLAAGRNTDTFNFENKEGKYVEYEV